MSGQQGREVVIVEAVRTPVGRGHLEKGYYKDTHPADLLGKTYTELISRTGIDAGEVEIVLAGCVQQFGEQVRGVGRGAPADVNTLLDVQRDPAVLRYLGCCGPEHVHQGERLGAGELCINSIDRDGTKLGYDLELTRRISEAVSIPVIASGGAGEPVHLRDAFTAGMADAAIVASIVHYGEHPIPALKSYLKGNGVEIRDAVMLELRAP